MHLGNAKKRSHCGESGSSLRPAGFRRRSASFPRRQGYAGQDAGQDARQAALDLELNMKDIGIVGKLKFIFVVIGLAVWCHAATDVFVEAVPPKGVKTCSYEKKNKNLFFFSPYQIDISLSREEALKINAGATVILSGKPVFKSGTDNILTDVLLYKPTYIQFRILGDSAMIGAVAIQNPKCDFSN